LLNAIETAVKLTLKEGKSFMKDEQTVANGAVALEPGTPAPDFKLRSTPDQFVSLSDFRGQPVILAFYPADWSPVCGDQLALYNELLSEFERFNAALIGISVDGAWCHVAYAKERKLHFRFSLTSNRKEIPRAAMAPIGAKTGYASAHCLSSIPRERFDGATYRRSA
jgi:peroxiredoxin